MKGVRVLPYTGYIGSTVGGGGGREGVLFTCPAGFSQSPLSFLHFFLPKIREGGAPPRAPPLDPPLASVLVLDSAELCFC